MIRRGATRWYVRPTALLEGASAREAAAAGLALPLAGGSVAFAGTALLRRDGTRVERRFLPLADLREWAATIDTEAPAEFAALLEHLSTPRSPWLPGLPAGRPLIMGVVNVTPDSFSDGGDHASTAAAIAHGRRLAAAGADILDVGGESTRPGAGDASQESELARVIPVIEALATDGLVVSVDTRRAEVMRRALAAGARIVNDVSALRHDPEAVDVVAESGAAVALMHMLGEPRTMQVDPRYDDVVTDVYDFLAERVAFCLERGIPTARIAVDPGFGFGKTVDHNLDIVANLALYLGMGAGVMLGVSRKSTIGRLADVVDPKDRLPGSLALGLAGIARGGGILRVHDVAETRQALTLWRAVEDAGLGGAREGER